MGNIVKYYLGIDVGGSHISAAFVNSIDGSILGDRVYDTRIDSKASAAEILSVWAGFVHTLAGIIPEEAFAGTGVAMPGPFDYERGISKIAGVDKFESIFGADVRRILAAALPGGDKPIAFTNDASAFAMGEYHAGAAMNSPRTIAVTLGTGFGSTFLVDGIPQTEGEGIPPEGFLFHCPMGESIADDYFSTRWFIKTWMERTGERLDGAEQIARLAETGDGRAMEVFDTFADNLASFMAPWFSAFRPDIFVMGGNISCAGGLFMDRLKANLEKLGVGDVVVECARLQGRAPITGAAMYACNTDKNNAGKQLLRKTTQSLMPEQSVPAEAGEYDIYPGFPIGSGQIHSGSEAVAKWMMRCKRVVIDGYAGVLWDEMVESIDAELRKAGKKPVWFHTDAAMRSPAEIDAMVAPYMGEDDSIFGRITDKRLADWFDPDKLALIKPDEGFDICILAGPGAALAGWDAPVIYADVPKNEIQFRMRAGAVTNLGSSTMQDQRQMYKRFYFVDWRVLDRHKAEILPRIDLFIDTQRPGHYLSMEGGDMRRGLDAMARNYFRVRPWFEPGIWGGQWMKERFKGLSREGDNLAWSFELMVFENGILFESDGYKLEVSFDFLMYNNYREILGDAAARFGYEFPIRFDFLDTFDGANLSVQCHPSDSYIREQFGMPFTQDETYYIMDCKPDATVYLGFQDDIDPARFRTALEQSQKDAREIDITRFVQMWPAKKHELYLIPNGTVHAAGKNNLVLEISSAPYIFTFKMYDWMRLDMDGRPRPINIEHGMNNLRFDRKGEKVGRELISKPVVISDKDGVLAEHLPTHSEQFYDVHRYTFNGGMEMSTSGKVHVWMLVEGSSVTLRTSGGMERTFSYAETFVIPAAAGKYTLTNNGPGKAVMVKAFVK